MGHCYSLGSFVLITGWVRQDSPKREKPSGPWLDGDTGRLIKIEMGFLQLKRLAKKRIYPFFFT